MTDLQEKLIANGYKKYVSHSNQVFKNTDTLYQKCVSDEIGKRYFINIWYYPETTINGHTIKEGVQMEAQFTDRNDVNVNLEVLTDDIRYIEDFFEEFWNDNDCGYYEMY